MNFKKEKVTDELIEEIKPLLFAHHDESMRDSNGLELDPDYDAYKKLCDAGVLHTYTIRDCNESDEHPELIGYATFLVSKSMRYKDVLHAYHDMTYIAPGKRGVGSEFISWCDERLKDFGVKIIYQNIPIGHGFERKLKEIGYAAIDTVMTRRL